MTVWKPRDQRMCLTLQALSNQKLPVRFQGLQSHHQVTTKGLTVFPFEQWEKWLGKKTGKKTHLTAGEKPKGNPTSRMTRSVKFFDDLFQAHPYGLLLEQYNVHLNKKKRKKTSSVEIFHFETAGLCSDILLKSFTGFCVDFL